MNYSARNTKGKAFKMHTKALISYITLTAFRIQVSQMHEYEYEYDENQKEK